MLHPEPRMDCLLKSYIPGGGFVALLNQSLDLMHVTTTTNYITATSTPSSTPPCLIIAFPSMAFENLFCRRFSKSSYPSVPCSTCATHAHWVWPSPQWTMVRFNTQTEVIHEMPAYLSRYHCAMHLQCVQQYAVSQHGTRNVSQMRVVIQN